MRDFCVPHTIEAGYTANMGDTKVRPHCFWWALVSFVLVRALYCLFLFGALRWAEHDAEEEVQEDLAAEASPAQSAMQETIQTKYKP